MKPIIMSLLISCLLFAPTVIYAQGQEYRPGGDEYSSTWSRFYNGDHEPELDDPLIEAGEKMTLVICEAVNNKDMRFRRYAISALGYIGDKRALPTLENILKSKDEIYYFRGDALQAIYQIDKILGKKYALEFWKEHEYLEMLRKAIEKDAKWLTEPTEE
ncbi:MAG: HEAT repeat domain-containing protein [Nitrospirae bacterium]|nr:HEAT repeat domain-containing protein [Nitrospirota bacterium]